MDVEWDSVTPAIPSGNLLPLHLYRALTEFADRGVFLFLVQFLAVSHYYLTL